ncbi:hypothetical protein J1N35_038692 [Gossypium stocksii]|uniref:FAD linked oxidase N-terminal domain-containing protein n=1 Tax=Gossypium stocksii TaxID=47602 RepID=A0A9D3UMC1_9ROSI|nr:hypothetical protein J1N35_038692 [Gossypium stocksii]
MITKGYLMFLINPFLFSICLNLRSVSVNLADETAWVGAGATLGELFYNIWKNSKVHGFRAGVCPTVGVGGHLSGAGRIERSLTENATDITFKWQSIASTTDENLFMRMLLQPVGRLS